MCFLVVVAEGTIDGLQGVERRPLWQTTQQADGQVLVSGRLGEDLWPTHS